MKTLRISMAAALATALAAGAALAQSATGSAQASGSAKTEVQSAPASGTVQADADAKASADAALRKRIEEKGAKMSAEERGRAEAQLDAEALEVDHTAAAQGEAKVAGRLAKEFNTTPDAMIAEKNELNASWGNLTIAHSIAANSNTDVTLGTLMGMKHDGMGWGQIAAGLDLRLGSVVSAVKTEGRVASGITRADGKVAPMRGVGARVGLEGGGGGAGVHAGIGHAGAGKGVGVGVGAGVKIKP